jgi:hypothetical protein
MIWIWHKGGENMIAHRKTYDELNSLCYIKEQVSYPEDNKEFGFRVHERGTRFFVTFESVLQSFGVMNRNRRMYDQDNIWNCIQTDEYIQDSLANNSWCGEMDHPQAEIQGTELTMLRIGNPDPGKTSHYIRKPYLSGNLLKAKIQTDSGTPAGQNFGIKIVDGKIRPAFSARVLGQLTQQAGKPLVKVRRLITYDWVMYPSHKEARADFQAGTFEEAAKIFGMDENVQIIFFPELAQMVAANSRASQFICESFDLTMDDIVGVTDTGNSVVITEKSNVYIAPINDAIVRNTTRNALKDFMRGNS